VDDVSPVHPGYVLFKRTALSLKKGMPPWAAPMD
jgi:hypothetical protein